MVIAFTGVLTSGLPLFWITVAFQVLVATACAGDLYRRDRNAPELPVSIVLQ